MAKSTVKTKKTYQGNHIMEHMLLQSYCKPAI